MTSALERRESYLRSRFLSPLATITIWDPPSIDFAAAYVALLHAETEHTLEELVRQTLAHAKSVSARWQSHPVLVNCVMFYRDDIAKQLHIRYLPDRVTLETQAHTLIETWDRFGVEEYFQNRLSNNHGAGIKYVENLFHCLGLEVSEAAFKQTRSRGVRRLASLPSALTTELTEFVVLRGSAVHAGTEAFRLQVSRLTPGSIATRGRAAVSFTSALAKVLAYRAW
jgi:hypothetical protein